MLQVKVRLKIFGLGGRRIIEGEAILPSTELKHLHNVVEAVGEGEHLDHVGWEAFFYEDGGERMLVAYINDTSEHNQFVDPKVLKY